MKLKLVLLVTINTIISIIRFITEWKNKKHPEVTYSYEKTHHQHHYDEHHHLDHRGYPGYEDEDKGWLSGLWSRLGSYDDNGDVRSIADAHDIAYSVQKPT